MIGRVIRGPDFGGLAAYLLGAAKQLQDGDVEIRNVTSVATCAREMHLNASRSRAIRPVYHLIIAWAHDENVTRKDQLQAGHRLLEKLDLGRHQAILVVHHEPKGGGLIPGPDGRHHELHIMASRVGPDGRAKRMSWEKAKVEVAIAEIANEIGSRTIPGHFNKLGYDGPTGSSEKAKSAAANGLLTVGAEIRGNEQLMRELKEARSRGWEPLLDLLRSHHFGIEESQVRRRHIFKDAANRGGTVRDESAQRTATKPGFVLVDFRDPRRREKLSSLDSTDLKWGRGAIENDLGPLNLGGRSPPVHSIPVRPSLDRGTLWDRYVAETLPIKAERTKAVAFNKEERDAIWTGSRRRIDKLITSKKRRRTMIRLFFGRRSLIGRLVNALLDDLADKRIAEQRAIRQRRLAYFSVEHKRELDALRTPRWADWSRAERAKTSRGERICVPMTAPTLGNVATRRSGAVSDSALASGFQAALPIAITRTPEATRPVDSRHHSFDQRVPLVHRENATVSRSGHIPPLILAQLDRAAQGGYASGSPPPSENEQPVVDKRNAAAASTTDDRSVLDQITTAPAGADRPEVLPEASEIKLDPAIPGTPAAEGAPTVAVRPAIPSEVPSAKPFSALRGRRADLGAEESTSVKQVNPYRQPPGAEPKIETASRSSGPSEKTRVQDGRGQPKFADGPRVPDPVVARLREIQSKDVKDLPPLKLRVTEQGEALGARGLREPTSEVSGSPVRPSSKNDQAGKPLDKLVTAPADVPDPPAEPSRFHPIDAHVERLIRDGQSRGDAFATAACAWARANSRAPISELWRNIKASAQRWEPLDAANEKKVRSVMNEISRGWSR